MTDSMRALVRLPEQIPRFVRLPGASVRFIAVEEVVTRFIAHLFPDYRIKSKGYFRVIRDSEVEINEEAEDLVQLFETALKRRRRGHVIRLSVDTGMPVALRDFVVKELEVESEDVFELDGLLGLADASRIITDDRPDLLFSPYNARFPERIRDFGGDCFAAIQAKDIIVRNGAFVVTTEY